MNKPSKRRERQVGGDHYDAPKGLSHLDFVEANSIPWCLANVMKYLIRHKAKNGRQDLDKAASYARLYSEKLRDETIHPSVVIARDVSFQSLMEMAEANGCTEGGKRILATVCVILQCCGGVSGDNTHRAMLSQSLAEQIERFAKIAYPGGVGS